jgi:hypothetical protein
MSSKQAVSTKQDMVVAETLVGHYFHVLDDRKCVQLMGQIVIEVTPEVYIVEYYDWIVGAPWDRELKTLSEMKGWRLYDSAEWMQNAWKDTYKQRQMIAELKGEDGRVE